jgi:hypothetical protein
MFGAQASDGILTPQQDGRTLAAMRRFLLFALLLSAQPVLAQTPATPADKLAWDMPGIGPVSSSYRYAVVVDGVRQSVAPTCQGDTDVTCSLPLPAMTPGRHVLQVIATLNGAESAPSADLVLTMVVVVTPVNPRVTR